jgi:iron(III) transport system substrate-binding protein
MLKSFVKSLFFLTILAALTVACSGTKEKNQVVVYTSVDQVFSEPILRSFEEQSGIQVLPVYDVEATKTTGLVNRLMAERNNPRADVFWNGEFAQTLLLRDENVLAAYDSPNAEAIPGEYVDPEFTWTGFAGRGRVILVNTDLLAPEEYPASLDDLLDPKWPANQIGIAYPLFGTTATHAAALYALWGQDTAQGFFEQLQGRGIQVVDGNSVVRDMVADGQLAFGLTDTDDACSAVQRGAPVEIIFPDQGENGIGTLIVPNTVALIAGGPNPQNGKQFIDFILSSETAGALIEAGWSQLTVRPHAMPSKCLDTPQVKSMAVSLDQIYQQLIPSKTALAEIFIR